MKSSAMVIQGGMGVYSPEQLEAIDVARSLEIYRERFGNIADFEFLFTGNIDLETAIPLIERYLGSLPGNLLEEPGKIQ